MKKCSGCLIIIKVQTMANNCYNDIYNGWIYSMIIQSALYHCEIIQSALYHREIIQSALYHYEIIQSALYH